MWGFRKSAFLISDLGCGLGPSSCPPLRSFLGSFRAFFLVGSLLGLLSRFGAAMARRSTLAAARKLGNGLGAGASGRLGAFEASSDFGARSPGSSPHSSRMYTIDLFSIFSDLGRSRVERLAKLLRIGLVLQLR